MTPLQLGKYQHYKGEKVLVIGIGKHSETTENMAVYVALNDNSLSTMWVRPLKMFLEEVEVNGKMVPRFKKIDEQ